MRLHNLWIIWCNILKHLIDFDYLWILKKSGKENFVYFWKPFVLFCFIMWFLTVHSILTLARSPPLFNWCNLSRLFALRSARAFDLGSHLILAGCIFYRRDFLFSPLPFVLKNIAHPARYNTMGHFSVGFVITCLFSEWEFGYKRSCFLTWAPIKGGFVTFQPHNMTLFTYIFTMQCKIVLILGSFKSLVNKLFIPKGKKIKNVSANCYGSLSIISQGWKMW